MDPQRNDNPKEDPVRLTLGVVEKLVLQAMGSSLNADILCTGVHRAAGQ